MGSIPYFKVGSTPENCDLIKEHKSTENKVFFAGDATLCEFLGSAHGAYISGIETAKDIINLVLKSNA